MVVIQDKRNLIKCDIEILENNVLENLKAIKQDFIANKLINEEDLIAINQSIATIESSFKNIINYAKGEEINEPSC